MDRINIFIAVTAKGPAEQEACGHYIIEYLHDGIPITYPPPKAENDPDPRPKTHLYREKITARTLTVELLTNAIYVLPFLLERYVREEVESISVYMDKAAAGAFVNKWYEKWEANDWQTGSGKPVPDAEEWRVLCDMLESVSQRFIFDGCESPTPARDPTAPIGSGERPHSHNYYNWMHDEAEKALKWERIKKQVEQKRKENDYV